MKKQTVLALLRKQYPEFSKDQLYARILCEQVRSRDGLMRDPKALVAENLVLELLATKRFVSRGGEKLQYAIGAFEPYGLCVIDAVVLDAGASSGGFTDCLLQHGCRTVYAVDSGKNQLDFTLRKHPKVQCFEGCKIQDFLRFELPKLPKPDLVVMDIAFRSILDLIPQVLSACQRNCGVFLCKPQFEWQAFCTAQPEYSELKFEGILSDELAYQVFAWFCRQLEELQIDVVQSCASPLYGLHGLHNQPSLQGTRASKNQKAAKDAQREGQATSTAKNKTENAAESKTGYSKRSSKERGAGNLEFLLFLRQ